MPLIGALVIKEFQTWLRGRLTFAARRRDTLEAAS